MLAVALTLVLGAIIARSGQADAVQPVASNQTAAGQPYWRRPGCFRVGHIRPIVIPGCLKFNLSTNACRGYCMSYSLPATDELQPLDEVVALLTPQGGLAPATTKKWSSPLASQTTPEARLLDGLAPSGNGLPTTELPPPDAAIWISRPPSSSSSIGPTLASQLVDIGPTSGGPQSAVVGESSASEVVSVSQCCSMLETEDVIVSLRCVGQTEIRQFIFKSAKTCECFFCKKA